MKYKRKTQNWSCGIVALAVAAIAHIDSATAQKSAKSQDPPSVVVGDIGPELRTPDRPKIEGHWGEDALGIAWEESDSVDDRWNKAQVGPFLASTLPTPTGTIAKGLSVRLYDKGMPIGAIGYDTQTMSARVAWVSGFLKFDPARFGIINPPQINGEPIFSQATLGWGDANVQFRGLILNGQTVVLQYDVNGTRVQESPSMVPRAGQIELQREFVVGPAETALVLELPSKSGGTISEVSSQSNGIVFDESGEVPRVHLRDRTYEVKFTTSTMRAINRPPGPTAAKPVDFINTSTPGSTQGSMLWPETLTTIGIVSPDSGPLVVDTVTVPFDNPYKALMFISGHDFFTDGRAAACTLHGDVWIVGGLDENLRAVSWKRFATGLYQPLGLRIVDEAIYVLGRDQITRLHDRDGNGEADYYECFSNCGATSTSGHDYAAGLEMDSKGDFYYARANTGVMKVSSDGTFEEPIAAGFRNPAGVSVGPDDTIVASPQEGEWTPSSAIVEVQHGGWYGFGGPKVTPRRPLGYDLPLCWTPRLVDNSTGGHTWVTSDRWGPLQGQLLTLSFGRCQMLLTLRDQIDGVSQGGSVPLGLRFESGLLRGRFHPVDGQLYVSGLKGWVSSATRDGCLQRVRYTGQSLNLPVQLRVQANGLLLTLSEPLDEQSIQDVDNYHLQQWNYRYSSTYGSDDYRVSLANQPGRDEIELQSASLMPDGRTIFLEIPDLQPVMQMKVSYTIRSRSGESIHNSLYHTINVIPNRTVTRHVTEVTAKPGRLDRETRKRLKSGMLARFRRQTTTGTVTDVRHARIAALSIPVGEPASSLLGKGPFDVTLSGYVRSEFKGDVQFWLDGPSDAVVKIDGNVVEVGKFNADAERPSDAPAGVNLSRGYNRLEITSRGGYPDGMENAKHDGIKQHDGCRFRLMWSSADVPPEPIPTTALYYDGDDQELRAAERMRTTRELFATSRCIRCHAIPRPPDAELAMPELSLGAPQLNNLRERLNPEWVAHWLFEPRSLRNQATMPHVLPNTDLGRQEAIDLTGYLFETANLFEEEQLGTKTTASTKSSEAILENGLQLYESRGCLACHRFTPPGEIDKYDRVSLHFANAKFRAGKLAEFLREPHRHFDAIRMPDFGFDEAESIAVAAYIQSQSTGQLTRLVESPASPQRGKELFVERRCAQCHTIHENGDGDHANKMSPAPFGTLFHTANLRGCLAAESTLGRDAPDFGFDSQQRESLLRFLHNGDDPLRSRVQGEIANRLLNRLRCQSCHDRDNVHSSLPDILADEGELGHEYDRIPNLGLAGEKLQTDWLQRQIGGQLTYRSRPWLKMRMPAFPYYANLLSTSLAAEHGLQAQNEAHEDLSDELATIGERLSSKADGFDCHQCHSTDDTFVALENKANGVGLSHVTDRLRQGYYHRWMRDPLRIDPLTKMPKFTEDGVVSSRNEILNGDARQQFDALWHYMQRLNTTRAATAAESY